jgi:hypothetical protein
VVAFMVQFGVQPSASGHTDLLDPLLLLLAGVCAGLFVVTLLQLVVRRARTALRARRGQRRWRRAVLGAEERARAQMSELCPHGWRAQITLLDRAQEDERPGLDGRPVRVALDGRPMRVALDWVELEDPTGRPAVMRRVLAPTIAEALDAMVADRRTDETLEQIEQGAVADGALWPEL